MSIPDDRDMPLCWWPPHWPGRDARYLPIPAWPRHFIDPSLTAWFACCQDVPPTSWQFPHLQRRLRTVAVGGLPSVRLGRKGRSRVLPVALLWRAALDPDPGLWLDRIGPITRRGRGDRRHDAGQVVAAEHIVTPPVAEPVVIAAVPSSPPAVAWPPMPDDDDEPRHGRARLDEADVVELRRLHREGWHYRGLAERFGVSENAIYYAAIGKTWAHVAMPD